MKILVTVKKVADYEAKLQLSSDKTMVETQGVNAIINPFDEIAVEEALRIREKHNDAEVIVVSVGEQDSESQIRAAMAMGADRGIRIDAKMDDSLAFDSCYIAKILKAVVDKEQPNIIIMGKQAIDTDNQQVAQMLGEMTHYPQATQANTVEIKENMAVVKCEADGGLETVEVDFPCIITTDLRLNEPRYASLPNIMKAKRKPLEVLTLDDLKVQHSPTVKVTSFLMPPKRASGVIVGNVEELIQKLKNEAKVL